ISEITLLLREPEKFFYLFRQLDAGLALDRSDDRDLGGRVLRSDRMTVTFWFERFQFRVVHRDRFRRIRRESDPCSERVLAWVGDGTRAWFTVGGTASRPFCL